MVVDWLKLIAALVLLLVPIALFHGKKVHYRHISRDWDRRWPQIAALGLHSIDLLRAILGAWLLATALSASSEARGLARHAPFVLQGGVQLVAVLLQTVLCKERGAAHAPFAFVAGLIVGSFPPVIAAFALLLTVVLAAGSRSAIAFFPLLAAAVVSVGWLFAKKRLLIQIGTGASAALLPWLVSLLFRRPLVISYRARRSGSTPPIDPPS